MRENWGNSKRRELLLQNTLKENAPKTSQAPLWTRPLWAPVYEAGAIALCFWTWVALGRRLFAGPSIHPLIVLATLLFGIVAADAASGLIHWFFDTFLEETTPVVGSRVVAPFREHHRDPLAMTRHGFLELNGNNCTGLFPILAAVWWFGPTEPQSTMWVGGYLFLMTMSFMLIVTNQLHCWAHVASPPRIGFWLQRCGLVVSPAHHARHHAPPHQSSFCVTNGWVNYFADRFSVFARAERLLVALGLPRKASDR